MKKESRRARYGVENNVPERVDGKDREVGLRHTAGSKRYALSDTVPKSKMNRDMKATGQGGMMHNKPSERADWNVRDADSTPKKA
jgi:hypothetical protein